MKWQLLFVMALLCAAGCVLAQEQTADPHYRTHVKRPAFTEMHPRVGIDQGHLNFHTMGGRYKPFAELLESDGYALSPAPPFRADLLKHVEILVIANAQGQSKDNVIGPAFTPAECDAVQAWVRGGGSLLLIADHSPFGNAAAPLAQRFGVEMGKGYVMDRKHSEEEPTTLVFSRHNGLLGDHAILRGRGGEEQIRKVVAFTGQSLSVPAGATPLLTISGDAVEVFTRKEGENAGSGRPEGRKLEGRAQGIALPFGSGRVAIFGEAAMFTAQTVNVEGQVLKMGMNVPGNDDRQFALNVVHWLARLID